MKKSRSIQQKQNKLTLSISNINNIVKLILNGYLHSLNINKNMRQSRSIQLNRYGRYMIKTDLTMGKN